MRLACDTGGTFTDLVVEADGELRMYKTSTTPDDPIEGVLNALTLAAADAGLPRERFLSRGETFVHGTTRAINAILTGNTARTAFLTTEGHPDILVIREGGRIEPFNFTVPYPEPYVPRALTFEIPERIDAAGQIVKPLDEDGVLRVIERLRARSRSKRSASACCGRSRTRSTSSGSASCSPSICPRSPAPSRTGSTRRCASTAARPRPASTPRSSR